MVNNKRDLHQLTSQIAQDVLDLWWEHARYDRDFPHITQCLPALAEGCPAAVLPILLERLGNSDKGVRAQAAEALGQIGKATVRHPEVVPKLVTLTLHDAERRVRDNAAAALGQMGEATVRHPEVVPRLLAALDDVDKDVRVKAVTALMLMGESVAKHPGVVSRLLAALEDDADSDVRKFATVALGRMREAAIEHPGVIPGLTAVLHDADERVRDHAAEALRQVGEAAALIPEVLPGLVAVYLRQRAVHVRQGLETGLFVDAALAPRKRFGALKRPLWILCVEGDKRIAEMYHLLLENHVFTWVSNGTSALRLLKAGIAPDVLITDLIHPGADGVEICRYIKSDLDGSGIFVVVITALGCAREIREGIAGAEVVLPKPFSLTAIRILMDCALQRAAQRANTALGALTRAEVLPTLMNLLRSDEADVRKVAAQLLGEMGETPMGNPEVIQRLVATLHDEAQIVRRWAAYSLARIGSGIELDHDVPSLLVDGLFEGSLETNEVVAALGAMGEAAARHPKVIPALLQRALPDEDSGVRWSAVAALERLMARGARIFKARGGRWNVKSVAELSR